MKDEEKSKVIPFPMPHDAVNHPNHYCDGGIETIDYIKAKLGPFGFYFYCLGNVIKYVSRAGKKGDETEDLAKAQTYLGWAIEVARQMKTTAQSETK